MRNPLYAPDPGPCRLTVPPVAANHIVIGANVLVRDLTQDDPAQAAPATRLMEQEFWEDEPGYVGNERGLRDRRGRLIAPRLRLFVSSPRP